MSKLRIEAITNENVIDYIESKKPQNEPCRSCKYLYWKEHEYYKYWGCDMAGERCPYIKKTKEKECSAGE